MLTGKQRACLRKLANGTDAAVYIGKAGLTPATINEMDAYLEAHEMLKVKLQEAAALNPKDTANEAAEKLGAEFVQAIGNKFILYRKSLKNPQIILPK